MKRLLFAVLVAGSASTTSEVVLLSREATSEVVQGAVDPARFAKIDEVINADIKDKKLPGAVVVVGQGDAVHYRKVYGNRALVPTTEPMMGLPSPSRVKLFVRSTISGAV